jgi:chromosome segregation ATPase
MWMAVLTFAVVNLPQILALILGLVGLAGVIFTALKYNRDDTTAIVGQQSTILNDMKSLNEELRSTATSLREERDALRTQVENLTGQVEALRGELHETREHLSGGVDRIEKKLDDGNGNT